MHIKRLYHTGSQSLKHFKPARFGASTFDMRNSVAGTPAKFQGDSEESDPMPSRLCHILQQDVLYIETVPWLRKDIMHLAQTAICWRPFSADNTIMCALRGRGDVIYQDFWKRVFPGDICTKGLHDDVIKWKHFPRYWPFVRGINRSPLNSPHKGQWRGSFDVFFDLRLNKRSCKQSRRRWFETPSRSLWRHCNESFLRSITTSTA